MWYLIFLHVQKKERGRFLLLQILPFVSVGNCSGMYRCDALFSSVGGDSFHVSDT